MNKQKQHNKTKKRGTLGWIMEFAGSKKSSYVFSVLLAVCSVLCGFIPYVFMANVVRGLLEKTADMNYCLTQCLWMALFFVLDRLFHAASTTMSHKATFEVLANIRRKLTKKLARMPLGDVLDESSGTYKNIIVERVDSIETTLAHLIPEFTSNLIIPFVIFAYMLRIDWRLALLSLVTVPVGALFFMLMMRGSGESYQNTVVKTKALNDTAVEYIGGIEVIKAFGKAKTSYEKFVIAAQEGADCFIEWMRRCNVYQNAALVLMPATLLPLLPFGISFYMKGTVTAFDFLMLIILSLGLITPFVVAASYMDDITKMGTIIGEVTDILEKRELVRPDIMMEKPKGTDIRLEDVHFAYKEAEVLHGASIPEKTTAAFVGPSGGGKTTLCHLMARFWDVQEGEVLLDGRNVKDYSYDSLMKNFSFVFQNVYLFEDTVANNIRFGEPEASMERVMEAAKKAKCHDFIMSLPKGYETIIGEGGASLSGGEKQRISIARAIMKDAPVIILDEATANVDPENETELTAAIEALTREKTIIMIAHRLKTVRNADQIFVIDNGQISQKGTHEELLKQEGIYKSFVEGRQEAASWKIAASA